jgi:PAS domain S-box-containing protein
VDANSKALETIGASREHVIGKVCHSFIYLAEERKCPISDLGQAVDKSEHVLLRANGKRIPILKTITTIVWRSRKYMIESFIDITERKQAEQAIQESQEKFKRLFMDNPEAAVYVDPDFHILDANLRFSELFGCS